MKRSTLLAPLFGLNCALGVCVAQAEPRHDHPPRPAFAGYALQGGVLGAGLGVSVAHFVARGNDADWRQAVTITGIGALSGMAGGAVVGFSDAHGDPADQFGYYTLKTMNHGQLVGALAGAGAGGLLWLNHGEALNVADGAAVGALAGALTGALFAALVYEPPPRRERERPAVNIRVGSTGPDGSPGLFAVGSF